MASAAVMSPTQQHRHADADPLPTPVLRLDSIFERTGALPQPGSTLRHGDDTFRTAGSQRQRSSSSAGSDASGERGASPQPDARGKIGAAGAGGAHVRAELSPSPELLGGSAASSDVGSPSPDAASDVGLLPQAGDFAGAARRSPFGGAVSMSLDQVRGTLSMVAPPPQLDSWNLVCLPLTSSHLVGTVAVIQSAASGGDQGCQLSVKVRPSDAPICIADVASAAQHRGRLQARRRRPLALAAAAVLSQRPWGGLGRGAGGAAAAARFDRRQHEHCVRDAAAGCQKCSRSAVAHQGPRPQHLGAPCAFR
jgi:hypothetical protein